MNAINDKMQYHPINYKTIILSKLLSEIFNNENSIHYQTIRAFLIKGLNLCDNLDDIACVFSDIPNINNTLSYFSKKTYQYTPIDIINFKINNAETFELIKELYIEKLLLNQ